MNSPDLSILANLIATKVAAQPEFDVLTFVDVASNGALEDETRNYQELWQNGQRIAAGLIETGMAQGDAFGLVMQNHPEMIDAMVGSSIAGTVFVPIDARTRGKKLTYMLDFAECKGVIVADYALAQLKEVLAELPHLKWVWVLETGAGDVDPGDLPGARYVGEVLNAKVPELAVRTDSPLSPMQMLYTSGTTGDPKAIMGSCLRFGMMGEQAKVLGLRADDRLYTGLSLTHSNAQITLAASLYLGLPAVFSLKFTKSRLWDITRRYGCTMFNLLGGMTNAIYSEPERSDVADNPV